MRNTTLHRHHPLGFMTTEETPKTPPPRTSRTVKDILERLKYRLDHPRFLERGDYDENHPPS